MSPPRYFIGDRFGRLTLIQRLDATPARVYRWLARCDCGTEKVIRAGSNLALGRTQSCGCLQKELLAEKSRKHGHGSEANRSAEYKTWLRIKKRCGNPASKDYAKYGARGIAVCERWASSFEAFLQDMGPRPSTKHSIDRIDGSKGYSPENCRWATNAIQSINRRTTKYVTLNGKRMFLTEAETYLGIRLGRISNTCSVMGITHQAALEYIISKQGHSL